MIRVGRIVHHRFLECVVQCTMQMARLVIVNDRAAYRDWYGVSGLSTHRNQLQYFIEWKCCSASDPSTLGNASPLSFPQPLTVETMTFNALWTTRSRRSLAVSAYTDAAAVKR